MRKKRKASEMLECCCRSNLMAAVKCATVGHSPDSTLSLSFVVYLVHYITISYIRRPHNHLCSDTPDSSCSSPSEF